MKPFDSEVISGLKKHIDDLKSQVVIIPHVNPDGDAMGSSLGLARVLKNAGKKVKVIVPSPFPDFYNWLTGSEDVLVFSSSNKKQAEFELQHAEMLFCLDFNDPARTGDMKETVEKFRGTIVLIDHHPYPTDFTDFMISHPEYSSTAELAFHVIKSIGYEKYIDQSGGECFFCGIMTDTGGFNHNVSDPQTFQTVSELLTYGVDPVEIHGKVFDNYSADRMKLLGYCLSECMEVFPEKHTAIMYLSKEIQKKFNFVPGDSEGFVNYPLSIKGIHFSALFTEKEDHVKTSFRSKGEFAVNEFSSAHFNGGGHRNAAGGQTELSLEKALAKFRNLLSDYAEELEKTKQ